MSKRATELSDKIGYATFDRDEVARLIDALLLFERTRCAERFKGRLEGWKPISYEGIQIKSVLFTDGVNAIMEDEE
jgi:hypothetical protein